MYNFERVYRLLRFCSDLVPYSSEGISIAGDKADDVLQVLHSNESDIAANSDRASIEYFIYAAALWAYANNINPSEAAPSHETASQSLLIREEIPQEQAFIFHAMTVGMVLDEDHKQRFFYHSFTIGMCYLRAEQRLKKAAEISIISTEQVKMLAILFYLSSNRLHYLNGDVVEDFRKAISHLNQVTTAALKEGGTVLPLLAEYYYQFLEKYSMYMMYLDDDTVLVLPVASMQLVVEDQIVTLHDFDFFEQTDQIFSDAGESDPEKGRYQPKIVNALRILEHFTHFDKDEEHKEYSYFEQFAHMLRMNKEFHKRVLAYQEIGLNNDEESVIKQIIHFQRQFAQVILEISTLDEPFEQFLTILIDYLRHSSEEDHSYRVNAVLLLFKSLKFNMAHHAWNSLLAKLEESSLTRTANSPLKAIIDLLQGHKGIPTQDSRSEIHLPKRKPTKVREVPSNDSEKRIDTRFPTKVAIKAGSPLFETERHKEYDRVVNFFNNFKDWTLEYWHTKRDPHTLAHDVQIFDLGNRLRMICRIVDRTLVVYDLMTHAKYDTWQKDQKFLTENMGVNLDSNYKNRSNRLIASRE